MSEDDTLRWFAAGAVSGVLLAAVILLASRVVVAWIEDHCRDR